MSRSRRRRRRGDQAGEGRLHHDRRSDSPTIAKVGENMTLRRAAALSVGKGAVAAMCTARCPTGSAGSASWSRSNRPATPTSSALGRLVAMHVAAANPQALDPAGLDPAVVAAREGGARRQIPAAGQAGGDDRQDRRIGPQDLLQGETACSSSPSSSTTTKSVAQAIKEAEGKVGAPVKVTGFARYALGEGIEKQDIRLRGRGWRAAGANGT